jgi:hypothetical protein
VPGVLLDGLNSPLIGLKKFIPAGDTVKVPALAPAGKVGTAETWSWQ